MLIPELRELLKKYKKEELSQLITEMYKSMPKKLREEKNIDAMLQNFSTHKESVKALKSAESDVDVTGLKPRIELFIEHAHKQYYFAPNKFVSKSERENWKATIKSYIQDLSSVPHDCDDGRVATELLGKLYDMLSYACGYYIFKTQSPFRSVGIKQVAMLETVIARRFGSGIDADNMKSAIALAIGNHTDSVTSRETLLWVLIGQLKTPDMKILAIEQCDKMLVALKHFQPISSKKSWSSDYGKYEREEKIRCLAEMVFFIQMELCNYNEAIAYFKKNYLIVNAEVELYILLRLLWRYDMKALWLQEYALAVKNGVTPREELAGIWLYIQAHDVFPEGYYIK